MANRVEPKLTQPLFESLQKERLITLATVDHETSGPNVNALSWTYASNEKTMLFAVDNRSRIVDNIINNPMVVVTIFVNESVYSITGKAFVKQENIVNVPLKLALISIDIEEVRDVMFYGSKISFEPKYEKTYDALAAAKLDKQVMEALKKYTK